MPHKESWVDPEILVEDQGVVVYRTYKHNMIDEPRTYWFSTCTECAEQYSSCRGDDCDFDVRELKTYYIRESQVTPLKEHLKKVIRKAINTGEIRVNGGDR